MLTITGFNAPTFVNSAYMSHTTQPGNKKMAGLRIIGTLKIISATLLLALTFGIFQMLGKDIGSTIEHYVRITHIDTDNKLITNILAKASGVSAKDLQSAGIVTLIYAVLYLIEGIGLLMGKHWAEYLTIILTGALIPVEIYEIIRGLTASRIVILIINILIVCYLIYRLRANKRDQLSH